VVGDRLEGAYAVEHLLAGVAGQHHLEGGEPFAGVGAAGQGADPVARSGEVVAGGGEVVGGLRGRRARGAQPLAGLVELLGEDLQVAGPLGDQLRGLAGGGGLRFGRGGQRNECQATCGGEGREASAGGAGTAEGVRARHGSAGVLSSTAACRVS
jgi:hypothetical protein